MPTALKKPVATAAAKAAAKVAQTAQAKASCWVVPGVEEPHLDVRNVISQNTREPGSMARMPGGSGMLRAAKSRFELLLGPWAGRWGKAPSDPCRW